MTAASPIFMAERFTKELRRLTRVSHEMPMDLNKSLPWEMGVDRALPPKIVQSSWVYGTPHWDALTAAERHGLLWEETARDLSMFIWLEQTLPPLYMGYVNAFGDQLTPEVREYLMIFSKEEIVHTMAFRRYVELAGLRLFRPAEGIHRLFHEELPKMSPVAGILCTLIIEYVAELGAMHASQHDGIDPLTRALFKRHHADELRHIAFGKWVAESFFLTATPAEAAQTRGMAKALLSRIVAQFTFNAEIVERSPLAISTQAAVEAVRASAHNQALNRERFAELYGWLAKLGVDA